MAKHPCPASAQEASNAFMELREHCDAVEVHALEAITKARLAKTEMMTIEPKVLGMESGAFEELLYEIAGVASKARHMHALASKFMRNNNFELPVPPVYDEYDIPAEVTVLQRVPKRR